MLLIRIFMSTRKVVWKLSENPLTVEPIAVRDIETLQTIKEAVTVYRC